MHVTKESPEQTERRLRGVIAHAKLEVHAGAYWFEEFPLRDFPSRVREGALAVVRGDRCWSQLVAVRNGDQPLDRYRVWTFRFEDASDNSGFIGWLAGRIKRSTGSGCFVVCGHERKPSEGGSSTTGAAPRPFRS